jgi:hypothetical protein
MALRGNGEWPLEGMGNGPWREWGMALGGNGEWPLEGMENGP